MWKLRMIAALFQVVLTKELVIITCNITGGIISYNQTIELTCHAYSISNAAYKWTSTKFKQPQVTSSVTVVASKDFVEYTCTVTGSKSTNGFSSIYIFSVDDDICQSGGTPIAELVHSSSNVTTIEGKNITLNCEFKGYYSESSHYGFKWIVTFQNGTSKTVKDNSSYSGYKIYTHQTFRDCLYCFYFSTELYVHASTSLDKARITCAADYKYPVSPNSSYLRIIEPPRLTIGPMNTIGVKEHASVTFKCHFNGSLIQYLAICEWLKDGHPTSNGNKYQTIHPESKYIICGFNITSASSRDEGNYSCDLYYNESFGDQFNFKDEKIKSELGRAVLKLETDGGDDDDDDDGGGDKIGIIVVVIAVGATLFVILVVIVYLLSWYFCRDWYTCKNSLGNEQPPLPTVVQTVPTDNMEDPLLTEIPENEQPPYVPHTNWNESGVQENEQCPLPTAVQTVPTENLEAPLFTAVEVYDTILPENEQSPYVWFVEQPKAEIIVLTGNELELSCKADGAPGITVKYCWLKCSKRDGSQGTPTDHSSNKMIIPECSHVNKGYYLCEAIAYERRVTVRSRVAHVKVVDSNNICVTKQSPREVVIKLGDNLILECHALCGPYLVKYQWYKGSELLEGATQSVLTIPSVSDKHIGSYNCIVTSDFAVEEVVSKTTEVKKADDIDQWTTSQVKRDSETSKKELLFSASEGQLVNFSEANKYLKTHYASLLRINISDGILGSLYMMDIITHEEKIDMDNMSIKKRIKFLLDHVIIPSLKSMHHKKYINFIHVMESSDDILLQSQASKLKRYVHHS